MVFERTRQQRVAPVCNFRAIGPEADRQFAATVLRYDTIDEYGTMFSPECFIDSLNHRMPRVVWGHDWTDPIGLWFKWENVSDELGIRLDMVARLDDFAAVPRARQAYAQLKSGTIDQFSIGFMPEDGEMVMRDEADIIRFTRARMDEASLVIVGAVPNTKLLALRSPALVRGPEPTISKDKAAAILLELHSGRLDLADALQEIKIATITPVLPGGEAPPSVPVEGQGAGAPEPGPDTGASGAPATPPVPPAEGEGTPPPAGDAQPAGEPPAVGAGGDAPPEGTGAGDPPSPAATEPGDSGAAGEVVDEMDWDEFADVDDLLANF